MFQNGLDLTIKTASTNSPWAYIMEGLLTEGYLHLRFGGLIFGGLIIGILWYFYYCTWSGRLKLFITEIKLINQKRHLFGLPINCLNHPLLQQNPALIVRHLCSNCDHHRRTVLPQHCHFFFSFTYFMTLQKILQ